VPGRAKRIPNTLVLLSLFPEKRDLWSVLGFPPFWRYRGMEMATEMLIAVKDHGGAQTARPQCSALAGNTRI